MCIEVLGAVFSGWSREAEVASRRRIRANAQEAPIVQFIMFIMFGIQASLWPLSQALSKLFLLVFHPNCLIAERAFVVEQYWFVKK